MSPIDDLWDPDPDIYRTERPARRRRGRIKATEAQIARRKAEDLDYVAYAERWQYWGPRVTTIDPSPYL